MGTAAIEIMGIAAIEREINDPRLAEVLRIWRRVCGPRFAPSRREIQPADFRQMLGRLAIVDVLPDGTGEARYRYRLMGTRLAAQDAFDLTGKPLSQHPMADQRPIIQAAFDAALARRAPVYREDARQDGHRRHIYARLVLPLSEDAESVTGFLLGRVVVGRT
jgi:hypothetical protein